MIEITGFVLLLLWIPLHQRPGIGTILNAVEIGLVVNLIGNHLPSTERLVPRLAYVVGAVLVIAVGSGLYIGAGLGTGPRDGIMVGLATRGYSSAWCAPCLEAVGARGRFRPRWHVGVGTVAFMLGIGPLVARASTSRAELAAARSGLPSADAVATRSVTGPHHDTR